MSKICLIKQPAGLGDILFCQKIAKVIQANTDYTKVIWPVASVYAYLTQYVLGEGIHFCDVEHEFDYKEIYLSNTVNIINTEKLLYLPLESANYVMHVCKCHQDPLSMGPMKYDFCKIPYADWLDYVAFKRNIAREKRLIERLNLDLSHPYNLINNHYGTFPHFLRREDFAPPKNQYRNIHMNFYEDTTLFDWIQIFENAAEIHTMDTSVTYILQRLGLENVTVYSRFKEGHSSCFINLFNKNWIFR